MDWKSYADGSKYWLAVFGRSIHRRDPLAGTFCPSNHACMHAASPDYFMLDAGMAKFWSDWIRLFSDAHERGRSHEAIHAPVRPTFMQRAGKDLGDESPHSLSSYLQTPPRNMDEASSPTPHMLTKRPIDLHI